MPEPDQLLQLLVEAESPSSDVTAVRGAQERLADLGTRLVGAKPHWEEGAGVPVVSWHLGDPDDRRRVLLLGHVDTVWPVGTLEQRPFTVADGRARGPGAFDMKAGLVVALQVLARLDDDVPVSLVVTGDEEVGSAASRHVIEREAARAQACLVLEGSGRDGAVKSARKGWSFYTFTCRGKAAHAGLEPHEGVNALRGLADLVLRVVALDAPEDGLSVTPTMATSGTTVNTVPAHGELVVDVRSPAPDQQRRVDAQLRELTRRRPHGVEVQISGGVNRPPMTYASAAPLVERLRGLANRHAWPEPSDVAVGGISDANLTAALGVPTLDGLGAVGGGPHAEHEWVDLNPTQRQVDVVSALVRDLVKNPLKTDATTPPPEGRR